MTKRYPLLGIVAVVVAYLSITLAILASPWFSWLDNALSDLGNTSVQRNITSGSALVFDGGLIISGVLTIAFAFLLLRDFKFSWKYLIWGIPLTISAIDLSMIGIFNESFGNIHLVVSIIFFFFTALSLFLYSYVSFPMGTPKTGALALFLGVFCCIMWVGRWPWQGVAIQEVTTSAASAAFVIILSILVLSGRMKTVIFVSTERLENVRSK
ncbi:MAG TPA: DUF998 domain-containing protein [Nitrososphaerales archaeon]|nr:DUF998 domain-containing protein [Nitrososphaerales archaeon]